VRADSAARVVVQHDTDGKTLPPRRSPTTWGLAGI